MKSHENSPTDKQDKSIEFPRVRTPADTGQKTSLGKFELVLNETHHKTRAKASELVQKV